MSEAFRRNLEQGEAQGQGMRLALPRAALRGLSGARLGQDTGHSVDFQDYRAYQPGDDLRHVDWGVMARSDQMVIKLFRNEVSPHLDLILDTSASMSVAPGDKSDAGLRLAAGVSVAARNARCSTALWITGNGWHRVDPPQARPALWEPFAFDARLAPPAALDLRNPALRRNGLRVLVSDLLWPGDPLAFLRRVGDGASAVAVVQLLGARDRLAPEPGFVRLVDAETGEEVDCFLNEGMRAQYQQALVEHVSNWQRACRQTGARFVSVPARQEDAGRELIPLQEAGLVEPT
jgi:uncharacterized protein (DUF58 family)